MYSGTYYPYLPGFRLEVTFKTTLQFLHLQFPYYALYCEDTTRFPGNVMRVEVLLRLPGK